MKHPDNDPVTSRYTVESTSSTSSNVNRIILYETDTTRRILESKIVKKTGKSPKASLHITLVHERKGSEGWTTDDMPKLSTLKGGDWVSCELGSEATHALYEQLSRLYAVGDKVGIENYINRYLVVKLGQDAGLSSSDEAAIAQILNECHHSPDFAKKLSKINPDLISEAYDYQILQHKQDGLAKFKVMLEQENCAEQEWQDFLKEHSWILGGVHDIHYLSDLIDQPIFAGANVNRVGEKRGDFLACTSGNARFTAIVEIKKNTTALLKSKSYREGIYMPSEELMGGVTQLRAYLRKWEIEGCRQQDNNDHLEGQRIYTVQPRGFLIVGNLDLIQSSRAMRESFELFRANQKDIHILTFDEVYGRARHLVGVSTE